MLRSLSSWRAWIEIDITHFNHLSLWSLSSWRAWIEMPVNASQSSPMVWSLSSWRAWIEIWHRRMTSFAVSSRSPHGERGLKCRTRMPPCSLHPRRSPHGERGLKLSEHSLWACVGRRSPHGERGLKCRMLSDQYGIDLVALLMESVD